MEDSQFSRFPRWFSASYLLLKMVCRAELVPGRLFAGRYSRAFSVHRKIKKKMKPSTNDSPETSCGADQWPRKKISDDVGKRTRLHIDQNSGDGKECDSHLASIITSSHKRRTRIDLGARFELPSDQTVEGIASPKIEGSRRTRIDLRARFELPSDQTVEGIASQEIEGSRRTRIDLGARFGLPSDQTVEGIASPKIEGSRRTRIDLGARFELPSDQTVEGIASPKIEGLRILSSLDQKRDSLSPSSFGKRFGDNKLKLQKAYSPSKVGGRKRSLVEAFNINEPFDICLSLEAPLQRNEMEKQSDVNRWIEENGVVLRPGMVLLKNYIPLSQQVYFVKRCQELGLGPGGFYRPGYKDGAKLRLHMMCLGLDWDPQTRRYSKTRQHDNAEPPCIPYEFTSLVSNALRDSHALIQRHFETSNPVEILPLVTPDICIVNFYSNEGRLGLHQDRDESPESLRNGLPVVSFSIGNSAEFLYGDERDVQKAEEVVLESGDVLIFGGKSRHIFHGVRKIIQNTAPPALSEYIKLRPGRLNLTFRQY